MRTIFIGLIIALLSFTAQAQLPTLRPEQASSCQVLGKAAEAFMHHRQYKDDLADGLRAVTNMTGDTRAIAVAILQDAYSEDLMLHPQGKDLKIREFKNRITNICITESIAATARGD